MGFLRCCSSDCPVVRASKLCWRHVLPPYIYPMLHCLKIYVLDLIRIDGSAWGNARGQWWYLLWFSSSLVLPKLSWSRSNGVPCDTCCHSWMCMGIFHSGWCIWYMTCCGWWWWCRVGAVQVSNFLLSCPLPFLLQVLWIWPRVAGRPFLLTQGRICLRFNVYKGPGKVVALPDGLKPRTFFGKPASPCRYQTAVSMIGSLYMWCICSFGFGRSCMKTERWLIMAVAHGTSYNEFRECWMSGMSSSRVSLFKFLTYDVKGMHHSVDCGYCHPFNTASPDTTILVVFPSYTFTSFSL